MLQEASPSPASKPRSSIRAGASRKLGLKRISKFRKHASGDFSMFPAIFEAPGPKRALEIWKRASDEGPHASKGTHNFT
jgi:hypothetical protein